MRNTYLFNLLESTHGKLIDMAEKCPADKRDTIPSGFNNNVRWHLGHIASSADALPHIFTNTECLLPESYRTSFGNGSKPADWNAETPDWDSIITQLRELPAKLRAEFENKLNDPVSENFASAQTLDEMLAVMISHANLHLGQVAAMVRILSQ